MFNRRQRNDDRRIESRGYYPGGDRRGRRVSRRVGLPERRTRVTDRRSIQDRSWLGPFDRRYRMMDRRSRGSA